MEAQHRSVCKIQAWRQLLKSWIIPVSSRIDATARKLQMHLILMSTEWIQN